MNEMITCAARAMAEHDGDTSEAHRPLWINRARAAIIAMRTPTDAMIAAGEAAADPDPRADPFVQAPASITWSAMVDEALK